MRGAGYEKLEDYVFPTHPTPPVIDSNKDLMPDPSEKPRVSIVIVNYNGKHLLDDCFSAVFSQTHSPFDVIMVDNASHDGSVDFIRDHFPQVSVLVNEANLGFAEGTNLGIRRSMGEFILTLNNDTRIDPSFLEEIIKPMIGDPWVGMCASKMLFPDGRINSTGICISRSGAAWDRGMFERDTGQYNRLEEVFGPCAGAALYRKAMFDQIGIFDEDFFAYMEDVDLAFRARLSGWKCMYVPSARVVHKQSGTAGFNSEMSIYYGNRNLTWYVVKDFPKRMLIKYLPWIIGRNIGVVPYYALHGKFWTIMKSKVHTIQGIRSMIKKRRTIKTTVPEDEIARWISLWNRSRKNHRGTERRTIIP